MIIDNFYIMGVGILPPEADPPLIVDPNAGEYSEAVRHLEQAVKLSPASVAAQSMLIKAYIMVGRWPDAEPLLNTLARLSPRTLEDYLFKGSAEGLLDPAKGLGSLDEAVRRVCRVYLKLRRFTRGHTPATPMTFQIANRISFALLWSKFRIS